MKLSYLPLLLILYLIPGIAAADTIDKIADLLRQGNTHELASLFASSVEISILDEENVYPRAQAEATVDKFLSQNKPKNVKILHKVSSNPNYQMGVLIVTADKGVYRITFTLKEAEGSLKIIELRIETEKPK